MGILDQLASSRDVRSDVPNQELAKKIAAAKDADAISELVANLTNRNKAIQSDCIKTLYEVGYLKPSLIAKHADNFIQLLYSKNNRLQWGAMIALNTIASEKPAQLFKALPRLAAITDKGTVITRDNYVGILVALMTKGYADEVFPLLNEQLISCPTNQLPSYAEKTAAVLPAKYRAAFITTLTERLKEVEQESKRKRIEKVLKKMQAR